MKTVYQAITFPRRHELAVGNVIEVGGRAYRVARIITEDRVEVRRTFLQWVKDKYALAMRRIRKGG